MGLLQKKRMPQARGLFAKLKITPSYVLLPLFLSVLSANLSAQSQPVTSITTYTQSSTASSYVGSNDGLTYSWGTGTETVLDTFTTANGTYSPIVVADNVIVHRVDNANVEGNRCTVFAEKTTSDTTLSPSFSCDPATIMSGRVINRGWLDVFSNDGTSASTRTANNIERIDFVYSLGIKAPATLADLQNSGHIVTEKSGNNPVVMGVITAVDGSGNPTAYAPLVKIWPVSTTSQPIRYGIATAVVPFSFLRDGATTGATQNAQPERFAGTREALGIAFVTLDDLGIAQGQTFYGFSYFPLIFMIFQPIITSSQALILPIIRVFRRIRRAKLILPMPICMAVWQVTSR